MIKYILAALLSFAVAAPAIALEKALDTKKEAAKKADDAKKAAAKPKNDPKWKNNSLSKRQAECRADPTLAKCKKPLDKAAKK